MVSGSKSREVRMSDVSLCMGYADPGARLPLGCMF
jgi:hypothetical protein